MAGYVPKIMFLILFAFFRKLHNQLKQVLKMPGANVCVQSFMRKKIRLLLRRQFSSVLMLIQTNGMAASY